MKLAISAITKALLGFLIIALLIFLPAGTFCFANGWLLVAILFIPMIFLGVVLFVKSPEMLEKRLDMKETQKAQKAVVSISAIGFIIGLAVAGLDRRFDFSNVPLPVVFIAAIVFLLGYAMYAEVVRENAYLSRTVKVVEDQKVIDTGLYKIVRHPMYTATVFMFMSMPLVLGSWYSFIVFLFYPAVIVVRIKNEEKLLESELRGYIEYKQKVKYRLIPFVW